MMKFKFLKHTADVKFQAFGKSLEEAFENSAYALKEVMLRDIKKIGKRIKKKIKVEGKDKEGLLLRFLEEFLFLLDSKGFVFSEIKKIKIEEKSGKFVLEAEVIGDKAEDYEFTNDVKAVTYNQMFVKKEKDKWVCQVVLDV